IDEVAPEFAAPAAQASDGCFLRSKLYPQVIEADREFENPGPQDRLFHGGCRQLGNLCRNVPDKLLTDHPGSWLEPGNACQQTHGRFRMRIEAGLIFRRE